MQINMGNQREYILVAIATTIMGAILSGYGYPITSQKSNLPICNTGTPFYCPLFTNFSPFWAALITIFAIGYIYDKITHRLDDEGIRPNLLGSLFAAFILAVFVNTASLDSITIAIEVFIITYILYGIGHWLGEKL